MKCAKLNKKANKKNRIKSSGSFFGGDKRIRTAGLLHAKQALYQLSYTPTRFTPCVIYSIKKEIEIQDKNEK